MVSSVFTWNTVIYVIVSVPLKNRALRLLSVRPIGTVHCMKNKNAWHHGGQINVWQSRMAVLDFCAAEKLSICQMMMCTLAS